MNYNYTIIQDWIDGLLEDDCERIAAASTEGIRLLLHLANKRLLPLPSDAAQPVAWRWRRTDLPQEPECRRWVYWYPGDPAHHDPRRNDLADRDDIEVQAVFVYAHPEDAPGGPTDG